MITELVRERVLGEVPALKQNRDYLDIYLYLVYGDNCFIPECIKKNGKISTVLLNKYSRELVLLLGRHIIESEIDD